MYAQSYPLTRVTLISRIDYSVFKPQPGEEIEQHLTLYSDGRWILTHYGADDQGHLVKQSTEKNRVLPDQMARLLSTINNWILCHNADQRIPRAPEAVRYEQAPTKPNAKAEPEVQSYWVLEATDADDETYYDQGPLHHYCKPLYNLSGMVRTTLQNLNLLAFSDDVNLPYILRFKAEPAVERRIMAWPTDEDYDDDDQYRYCQVKLYGASQLYSYLTTDNTVKPGDLVVVPVGPDNNRMIATVNRVAIYSEETAPYPPERTKYIIGKATADDINKLL